MDIEPVSSQANFNFEALGENAFSEAEETNRPGQILMQATPAVDVTGQSLRPQVFMTPLQMQMHQQLKSKHAELFKRIMEQQEELRRVSEQLLMTQYGLVPVTMTPAMASQTVAVVSTQPLMVTQPQSNIFGSLDMQPSSTVYARNPVSQHNRNSFP